MRPLKLSALVALSLTSTVALADMPGVDDIDIRLARSEAVVEGTVESVRFVTSQGNTAQPGVPHTFVTYHIDRVLRGTVRGDTVTLRFFGGLDVTGDELVFASNGIEPDVGDHDLLLIAGNGTAECPLIDCDFGRYRVIGGAVYDEHGRDVVIVDNQRLGRGTVRNLPDVWTWKAVGLSTEFETPLLAPKAGASATLDNFRNFLTARLTAIGPPREPLPPVISADLTAPFVYDHPADVAPPTGL